jgi:hypothetical protein
MNSLIQNMNKAKFLERANQYKNETTEALLLALDIIDDLASKYKNFEVYFTRYSAGLRKIKAKGGYLLIETSKKRKPGLFLGRKRLRDEGVNKEIINQTGKYSGSFKYSETNKKEQVVLFFKSFANIIKELDRYN